MFPESKLGFFGKTDYVTNDYLNDHYRAEFGSLASRFLGAVHVEAGRRAKKHIDVVGETEWLEQLDPDASTLKAFVGSAELDRPDLEVVLEAHAGSRLMRGCTISSSLISSIWCARFRTRRSF